MWTSENLESGFFFFIKYIYSNFRDFIINQDLVIDSAKFYQNMKVNV